jgi:O-antigen ligase
VWLAAVLLFLAARRQFAAGGLRQAARIVAALGFAVSLLGIAQAATGGRAMAWLFPTPADGARPFGPFVNRNHFATWVIMALPLTLGYIVAHARAHAAKAPDAAHARTRVAHLLDPRLAWLAMAAGIMLVALLLSLSRSGVIALGVSTAAAVWMARGSFAAAQRRWAVAGVLALVLFGVLWSDVPALAERVAHAPANLVDRLVIWRETRPIVRDFALAGTGAGTYQSSMFVYQQSDRAVYFNQAHNHYLQAAAEGGLLLAVPLCLAAAALVALVRRRIRDDDSGLRFVRIGATCGLGAVALQSVLETGLVMPANAALAAVLAAVAVHRR